MLYFVSDFETSTRKDKNNRLEAYVWSATICSLQASEPEEIDGIYSNIKDWFDFIDNLEEASIIYFHNLKYDGSYILNYLNSLNFQRVDVYRSNYLDFNEFTDMFVAGECFNIKLKNQKGKIIEIYDSYKFLNKSLKELSIDFDCKYKKTQMNYKEINSLEDATIEDIEYIQNDVLCLAECIRRLQCEGYELKTTSASTALYNFKCILNNSTKLEDEQIKAIMSEQNCSKFDSVFRYFFPKLSKVELPEINFSNVRDLKKLDNINKNRSKNNIVYNAHMYCQKASRGGWCYINENFLDKDLKDNLICVDANSLYTSKTSYNLLPYGVPRYYSADNTKIAFYNYTTNEPNRSIFKREKQVYILKASFNFTLKNKHLPCIRREIDNDSYDTDDWLKSGVNHTGYYTQPEWQKILENYYVSNLKVYSLLIFNAQTGLFDEFSRLFYSKKEEATMEKNQSKRYISKMILNNLIGKFSSKCFKDRQITYFDDDNILRFKASPIEYNEALDIYPALGAFVTAYARCETVRVAEYFYKRNKFVYSDTDSVFYLGTPEEANNIVKIGNGLNMWKIDKIIKRFKILNLKTYIYQDEKDNIILKVSGLPEKGREKYLFQFKDKEFENFKDGTVIEDAKLQGFQVRGGMCLVPQNFTLSALNSKRKTIEANYATTEDDIFKILGIEV